MSILVINTGSTSTKCGLFRDGEPVAAQEMQHRPEELDRFARVTDQYQFRLELIEGLLARTPDADVRAVVGRGGLLHPLEGGVYRVSDDMVEDLRRARYGEHPCNLGAMLAQGVARHLGVEPYMVDPVVTDEMDEVARVTGFPGIRRRSLFHALNQRGVARMVAGRLGVRYEDANFIVCHMGGGISIGAHAHGRVVDVVNALDGEGPFSPERTGGLPVVHVLDLISRGEHTPEELKEIIQKRGGLLALLGTNDLREVQARVDAGDREATLVFRAMAYTIGRHICSMTPALVDRDGSLSVDGVVLTGGLARGESLVAEVSRLVGHVAEVFVIPGEVEMLSMARAVERALDGSEPVREYTSRI